jgi:hypothetical protein
MIRSFAIFSCVVGFLVIILAVASTPQSGDVEARETPASVDGCQTREVALDQGYGVSRKVSQQICAAAAKN